MPGVHRKGVFGSEPSGLLCQSSDAPLGSPRKGRCEARRGETVMVNTLPTASPKEVKAPGPSLSPGSQLVYVPVFMQGRVKVDSNTPLPKHTPFSAVVWGQEAD